MNVLIVEDDPIISKSLSMALSDEGHFSDICGTAEDGLIAATDNSYDAIILDINLPDSDGIRLSKTLRCDKIDTPVLIVSGRTFTTDKVVALRSGADGYLTKPFDRQELVANLTAIVRRHNGHSDSVISTGPIAINLSTRTVSVAGEKVDLTGKEVQILELLALRKGATISKTQLINHLYNGRDEPELKIIDVFVCKLRKKLADHVNGKNFIHTIWGQGYALRDYPVPAQ
jgi:two-component system cell cycle response regulator CtrA